MKHSLKNIFLKKEFWTVVVIIDICLFIYAILSSSYVFYFLTIIGTFLVRVFGDNVLFQKFYERKKFQTEKREQVYKELRDKKLVK